MILGEAGTSETETSSIIVQFPLHETHKLMRHSPADKQQSDVSQRY